MQVLPTDEAVDAAAALAATITKSKPGRPRWSDAAFADRERLWGTLAAGQWTLIGAPDEAPLSRTDIAEIVMAWGTLALPVPLVPTILVRRWSWAAGAPAGRPLTYGLPAGPGRAAVPFAGFPGVALTGPDGELPLPPLTGQAGPSLTSRAKPSLTDQAEPFDLLMPVPVADVTVPSLTPAQVTDVCALALAEAAGVARGVLDDTVRHARSREQFGHPIATFQAVKHHCAGMHIDLEIAQAHLAAIVNAPDGQRIGPALADAFARLRRVAETGLQVHGAMGFAWETGLHFGLRHVIGLGELSAQALSQED